MFGWQSTRIKGSTTKGKTASQRKKQASHATRSISTKRTYLIKFIKDKPQWQTSNPEWEWFYSCWSRHWWRASPNLSRFSPSPITTIIISMSQKSCVSVDSSSPSLSFSTLMSMIITFPPLLGSASLHLFSIFTLSSSLQSCNIHW